ncbi:DNA ligase 1, partial [Aplysia californica]|uniref:DNA ligase 1 n=1 Tax=Aplysia californica TaxID=6500 RepID=A0ABM1A9A7_APLCA
MSLDQTTSSPKTHLPLPPQVTQASPKNCGDVEQNIQALLSPTGHEILSVMGLEGSDDSDDSPKRKMLRARKRSSRLKKTKRKSNLPRKSGMLLKARTVEDSSEESEDDEATLSVGKADNLKKRKQSKATKKSLAVNVDHGKKTSIARGKIKTERSSVFTNKANVETAAAKPVAIVVSPALTGKMHKEKPSAPRKKSKAHVKPLNIPPVVFTLVESDGENIEEKTMESVGPEVGDTEKEKVDEQKRRDSSMQDKGQSLKHEETEDEKEELEEGEEVKEKEEKEKEVEEEEGKEEKEKEVEEEEGKEEKEKEVEEEEGKEEKEKEV